MATETLMERGDVIEGISFDSEVNVGPIGEHELTGEAERSESPSEGKEVEWGFLNVRDFQVKGWKRGEEGTSAKTASISDGECEPFRNETTGKEFYRVQMNEGAIVEHEGKQIDLSGCSTTVSSNCVHRSEKYPRSVGISYPTDHDLIFVKQENIDGRWETTGKFEVSLEEAISAQRASIEHYKKNHQQEVEWGYLNVKDFQVRGENPDKDARFRTTSIDQGAVPFTNNETGKGFFRVQMNDGAIFERDMEGKKESFDISGMSAQIPEGCVRRSEKYPGNTGISWPVDREITFTKAEQIDGQWQKVGEVKATLAEAQSAQHASIEHFKKAQEVKQEAKRSVADIAKAAKKKAQTQSQGKEASQAQSKKKAPAV